ncbi:MAG: hypothetical protein AVDCRST_MAG05-3554, partial [uncultured Rubrobacteraceae bacterium]
ELRPQASPVGLGRHPSAAAGHTALRRRGLRGGGCGRPPLGGALRLPYQRALAALPPLPHPLGGGARPAQHPARREGRPPARRRRPARGRLPARLRAWRPRPTDGRAPLLRRRHPALRPAHAPHKPLAARRGRRRDGGLPLVRLRPLVCGSLRPPAGRVLGATAPGTPHRARARAGGARRGRGDLAGLRPARL